MLKKTLFVYSDASRACNIEGRPACGTGSCTSPQESRGCHFIRRNAWHATEKSESVATRFQLGDASNLIWAPAKDGISRERVETSVGAGWGAFGSEGSENAFDQPHCVVAAILRMLDFRPLSICSGQVDGRSWKETNSVWAKCWPCYSRRPGR